MKAIIAHLADIHLKASDNPVVSRSEQLARAIFGAMPAADHVLMVVAGDIAFSGHPSEYAVAQDFFLQVQTHLKTCFRREIDTEWIFVPGNHDCNFSGDQTARESVLASLGKEDIGKSSVLSTLCGPQASFYRFVEALPLKTRYCGAKSAAIDEIDLDGDLVRFVLVNSALCSRKHEQPGSLAISLAEVPSKSSSGAPILDLIVCHHPLHWLKPESFHKLRDYFVKGRSVLLTGHEHQPSLWSTQSADLSATQVEGGVLQESASPNSSSFHTLALDSDESAIEHRKYVWDGTTYLSEPTAEIPWSRPPSSSRTVSLPLKPEFDKRLNDPGDLVVHPRRTVLSLDDILIVPDLKRSKALSDKAGSKTVVRAADLVDELKGNGLTHIRGGSRAGKTCLSKYLFRQAWLSGELPLIMDGRDFRANSDRELRKSVEKAVAETYQITSPDSYINSPHAKILLIDGSERARGNARQIDTAIGRAKSVFDRVIMLSSSELDIYFATDGDELLRNLTSAKRYSILPLGAEARSDLISKWVGLGSSPIDNEHEVLAHKIETERLIDELLGRDLIPPTPFYVLSLLHAIDQNANRQADLGSLGYLYDLLIKASIAKAVKQPEQMHAYDRFLSELAYEMFKSQEAAISFEQFEQRCKAYEDRFLLDFDPVQAIERLKEALILATQGDLVYFKYKYIFCFFVAKYLSQKLSTEIGQDAVRNLSEHIHHRDSADILSFLCHCTGDPFVATSVVQKIESLFKDSPEVDIDRDVEFLNELLVVQPAGEFKLDSGDPEENRKCQLRKRDEDERSTLETSAGGDEVAEPTYPSQAAEGDSDSSRLLGRQLASSFRILEIAGQVLRNHPANIEAESKVAIVKSSSALIRRIMGAMLASMKADADRVVPLLEKLILEGDKDMTATRARQISRVLYEAEVESIAVSIIGGYAQNMSGQALLPVMRKIRKEGLCKTGTLLDIAVQLESPRKFPMADAEAASKKFEGNQFATNCLRSLVYVYLYLYRMASVAEKQRVCHIFGIDFSAAALLDPNVKRDGGR